MAILNGLTHKDSITSVAIGNDTVSKLYIGHPSIPLVVIYGATLAGLLVMVVVVVVIAAIVNHKQRGGTTTHYSVSKTLALQQNKRGN